MKVEDLVVLSYADNECYTNVRPLADFVNEIRVSLDDGGINGMWAWMHFLTPIGRARAHFQGPYRPKGGVIGVFDRSSIDHLNAMIHAAREFVEESSVLDD